MVALTKDSSNTGMIIQIPNLLFRERGFLMVKPGKGLTNAIFHLQKEKK